MADNEHFERIRAGVTAWNTWRSEHPEVRPDLRQANLVRARLEGANLADAQLEEARLIRARLEGADLRHADLRQAVVLEAEISSADLSEADLSRSRLTGSKLIRANLSRANLNLAEIGVSNLKEALLCDANLAGADLRESILVSADLRRANLEGCLFLGTRLEGANLAGARGLSSNGLEIAHTDEHTVTPDHLQERDDLEIAKGVYELLLNIREDLPEGDVEERQVFRFNAALKQLAALGHDVSALEIREDALSRRVDSWESTSGGEAFEMSPARSIDGTLFRSQLDRAIGAFREPHGTDSVSFQSPKR
jgi:Pentapeptide repeats (8 copies)